MFEKKVRFVGRHCNVSSGRQNLCLFKVCSVSGCNIILLRETLLTSMSCAKFDYLVELTV